MAAPVAVVKDDSWNLISFLACLSTDIYRITEFALRIEYRAANLDVLAVDESRARETDRVCAGCRVSNRLTCVYSSNSLDVPADSIHDKVFADRPQSSYI